MSRASRSCGLKCGGPLDHSDKHRRVTSFTLVWIKMFSNQAIFPLLVSRASRSCGLKCCGLLPLRHAIRVTSFTLVWIKIGCKLLFFSAVYVTSFTLVWIKIRSSCTSRTAARVTSFTLVWIKIGPCFVRRVFVQVTSFTLVWIKIQWTAILSRLQSSRASRSCGLKCLLRLCLRGGLVRHELHARVD